MRNRDLRASQAWPKVPGGADLQPYLAPGAIADPGGMAQRNNRLLLTTGLARVEGENVMYARASDNSSQP